jgi:hypothetical protein
MSTAVEAEPESDGNGKKGAAFAASVAVSYAKLDVTTTVADTATIYGGRTVNVRALVRSNRKPKPNRASPPTAESR